MQVSVVYSWQVSAFWWENTLWYDIDAFETGYPRSRPMIPATFCLTDAELYSRDLSNERLYQMCRVLRDTGFVVIENAIDPELIGRVKLEHDAALDNYMKSRGGLTGLKDKTFGINHVGFFPPILGAVAAEEIVANAFAVQIMQAAMGDIRCSFVHTNTACPGSGYQPIHRDTPTLFGINNAPTPMVHAVVNIPLIPFTIENGATEVWPGTHWIVDERDDDGSQLEERARFFPSQRTVLPVGAIVVRDLRMWHRGVPNPGTELRTMMAIVYQRAFVHEDRCNIPQSTWDGWSKETRKIFRFNDVVPDELHTQRAWY